ncbi:DUF2513 domain-containing protein [Paenibacillus sp. 7516]|uniref:DUF2513 domain-containing protein n=1 Tax=Paenibacillus sp. 7516 TaxID=2022549 RepID=UPI001140AD21|nr:DUF2513 domain-containing protein [Paenibacillus sp. 7516]
MKEPELKEHPFIMESGQMDNALVQYNVGLAVDHGLIKASSTTLDNVPTFLITGITWSGHEFLDTVRNDGVLTQAKSMAKEKGSKLFDIPFEVVKALVTKAAQSYFLGS